MTEIFVVLEALLIITLLIILLRYEKRIRSLLKDNRSLKTEVLNQNSLRDKNKELSDKLDRYRFEVSKLNKKIVNQKSEINTLKSLSDGIK